MFKTTTLIILIIVSNVAISQSLNLGFLFKPGITIASQYTSPASFNDSSSFGITKYSINSTIPLKTKIGVDLKKLNLKANQIFLTLNSSVRIPNFSNSTIAPQHIYTSSIGITSLFAGIKNGIWIYSANLYHYQPTNKDRSKEINTLAYFARIKIKTTKLIYFYGIAGMLNLGKPFISPIVGLNYSLNRKWKINLVLPIQLQIKYKINHDFQILSGSSLSGLNPVNRNNNVYLNYRELKNSISLNTKRFSPFSIRLDAGISTFKNISPHIKREKFRSNISSSFYASININYRFGKSLWDITLKGID